MFLTSKTPVVTADRCGVNLIMVLIFSRKGGTDMAVLVHLDQSSNYIQLMMSWECLLRKANLEYSSDLDMHGYQ